MSHLPSFSGKDVIRVLASIGYRVVRQRGSHIRLACQGKRSITVPNHHTIGSGLLRKILRDAELSVSEFKKLLG